MEFDKSRVFTTVNADELKVGSKVIVADNLASLKRRVAVYYNDKEFTTIAFGEDALKQYADNLTKEKYLWLGQRLYR